MVLSRVIRNSRELESALLASLHNGRWFTETLPPVLGQLAASRNPGAHTVRVAKDEARKVRDRLIAIGCKGKFVELAGRRSR